MVVVWLVRIALLAAFFLIWQYGGDLLVLPFGRGVADGWHIAFGSPAEIAPSLVKLFTTGKIVPQIIVTLVETLSAFAIGTTSAVPA